jgi:hypothetical protein
VFLAIAPAVLIHLARASGRPIREVARSLIDYTKNYEEKLTVRGTSK